MGGVAELWAYRGLVGNFASRELKGKYRRSLLGWGWSLLNPAATLGVYVLVFGFFLKFAPPVAGNGRLDNFALYLFTALVEWNFFYAVVTGGMGALVGAGPLLKKIYFPPSAPVAGTMLATLNQTGIELGILLIIYAALANISWTLVLVVPLLVLLVLFALGVAFFLALLNVYYRDVGYLVTIALNLLFYAAPIIYPVTQVQQRVSGWVFTVYNLNPITSFVQAFRDVLWSLQVPSAARFGYLTAVSLLVFAGGLAFFRRGAPDVGEEL